MMITMPMARESGPGGRSRRWWLRWPALVAAGFVASWIAGLSVWLSNLAVDAGAGLVNATFAAHHTVAAVQFVLTEGLPAIALALIPAALGLRARHAGQTAAGWLATVAGAVATAISLTQCGLGLALAGLAGPGRAGTAHGLFTAVNRLDGVKMLVLATAAAAAVALAARRVIPRWLGGAALALAVAITVSGAGYLLLLPALAPVAFVSGPLLLIWVAGTGVVLARHQGRP